MAQVEPEHARRRLGLRTPKAVAAAGIAVITALGIIGAARLHIPALSISSSSPSITASDDSGTQLVPAEPVGEPLLLQEIVVHVDGEVASPGVYSLTGETVRICDAVDAAGGLLPDADTSTINLAQPITDGMKVHIPKEGEMEPAASGEGASANALVNLNTATAAELETLPGVGEQTALAIIEDREQFGPFTSVDDLLRVSGIGEKKLEKIKPYACV